MTDKADHKLIFVPLNNQTSSQPTLASLPHRAFALQIRQNLGCKTLPYFVRAWLSLQQILLCPAAAPSSIVLPDFGRSWSADGGWFNWWFVLRLLVTGLALVYSPGRCFARPPSLRCAERGILCGYHITDHCSLISDH